MRTNSRSVVMAALGIACAAVLTGAGMLSQPESDVGNEQMEAWIKLSAPGPAHKAMEPMAGTFKAEARWWPVPGSEPQVSEGTMSSSWTFGGRYLEGNYEGLAMGMPFQGRYIMAYDNITEQYQSIWFDSMSTSIAYSTGTSKDGGKTITFNGTMPDPETREMVEYVETITIKDKNTHVLAMYMFNDDGTKWKSMELIYTRVGTTDAGGTR